VENNLLPWFVVLAPLIGFSINAFMGGNFIPRTKAVHHGAEASHDTHGHGAHTHSAPTSGEWLSGGIATALVLLSFLLSIVLYFQLGTISGEEKRIFSSAFSWIPTIGLPFRFVVDPLSSLMMLVITGVGSLIHLYSIGYMAGNKGFTRYFAYLNLFVFFMLLLVMGSNLIVLFVGWEGVGLASYLLIGFDYDRVAATNAGKKAFIVNRIGDAALLVALFIIYRYFGSFEYFGINNMAGVLTEQGRRVAIENGYLFTSDYLTPMLLLLAAAGKSAQIPLYVWLPDAMEGPTPVSALIHAATMVTGGIYLICRLHPIFLASPEAMSVVAVVGLTTAFLAAVIALTQTDIKKVLAYSTVSQLGYMFLACGVGAFGAAMFHVFTHAFFKALLFLGSGSVIHAMNGEQDMRKMGDLSKKLRITCATMWIGTLAIAGIPPLAGFFSKDEILANAYADASMGGLGDSNHLLFWFGWVVAGLTAFYMTRLMWKTFYGKPRYDNETARHIHESPPVMWIPLVALAIPSVFVGWLGGMKLLHIESAFEKFLEPNIHWRKADTLLSIPENAEIFIVSLSVIASIAGIAYAWLRYRNAKNGELLAPEKKVSGSGSLWDLSYNKFYVDEFYDAAIVRPGRKFANWLWRTADARMVDGTVNGVSGIIASLSRMLAGWQSGYARNYALTMLLGVVIVVIGCLFGLRMVGR